MKRFAKRCLSLLLFLLLLAAAFTTAAFSAAAEGGTTVLWDKKTKIEVEVETDALPTEATLYVVVGQRYDPNTGGLNLDPSLYWQTVTISIKGRGAEYEGSATVRIPLVNTSAGTVEDVKEILLMDLETDIEKPKSPEEVDFSVGEEVDFTGNTKHVLSMELELGAVIYVGTTGGIMISDGDRFYDDDELEYADSWFERLRKKCNDWIKDFLKSTKDEFNEFLLSDWSGTYFAFLHSIMYKIYVLMYPFGVFVLILSWAAGVSASGFTMNLDPRNKHSILRAVMQLLIGIILLSAAQQLMMLILSICNGLKSLIVSNFQVQEGHSFILLIFQLKIYLNLAYVALLQCVSPIFVATAAGSEGVRRTAVSFFKEFGLRGMELVLTTIYILLVDALEAAFDVSGLIATIVLSISVFSIDKKFEKLFH